MAWLGIPFQLSSSEIFYNARLALDKIPKVIFENADKSMISDTIIAAFIGGALPAIVAFFALRHNSKSLKDQLNQQSDLANTTLKAQIVTANRKDWVNDLRNTTSSFLASLQGVINTTNFIYYENSRQNIDADKVHHYAEMRNNHLQEMCSYSWKIKLLLKPEHAESAVVTSILDGAVDVINGNKNFDEEMYKKTITPLFHSITKNIKAIIDNEMVKFESIA